MSRVGRDYLQVGFYTEVLFRKHNVRFIAVSNNIDSDNKESTEFAPFLNLMSEWYARDCSRKIKTVIHAKGNSGKPLANIPIYGYKKDPDNKHRWLVDEEAAAIVRRIFQMTIDGISPYQITKILSDERVEKPSVYALKNDMPGSKKGKVDLSAPYGWMPTGIIRILKRPEYLGHVVNFRTCRESYKDSQVTVNAPEDWKIFENRHEKIIDQFTFDTVQKLLGTPRKHKKDREPNPLTGLLFCYDCKAKMYNSRQEFETYKRTPNGKIKTQKTKDYYDCSTYSLGKSKHAKRCSGHFIRTVVIRELVLDSIRNICGYVRENQKEFVEKIHEESVLQRGETAKSHKKAIAKNERRIVELDNLFRRTYEDNVNGKLSDTRFEQMSADYEREQAELNAKNAEMQAELDEFNADGEKVDGFIKLVKKYTEFEELTTAMLNEFIDLIFVHKAEKNEWGERVQVIDIHFNFIGDFKLPIIEVEPTTEEIAALEKLRLRRQKQREYSRRFHERQKTKLEQQKQEQAEDSA
jgi:hypothetical protein